MPGIFISPLLKASGTDYFGQITKPIVDALREFADGLGKAFDGVVGVLVDGVSKALGAIWDGLVKGATAVWDFLRDRVLKPILDAIQAALDAAAQAVKGLARTFVDTIVAMAPHSPAGGLEAGVVALGLAAGLHVVAAGAATALDAVHPFHSLEIKQLVFAAMASTGIASIGPAVVGRIFETAILKPMQQELNETFVREIPGPGDLVRFVVREQIAPDELELWLRRQGLGPKWSQAFWGAHWVPPSREEAVELHHRGIYTLQQVTDALVINDRRPDTIPDLLALTFRTPTRAELVQLGEVTDVDEDRLKAWLRADGVSEELLPTFLSLVRSRRIVRILTRVESLVRGEVEAGRLGIDEARSILQEYRFAPDVVEAELGLAKRARDLQLRTELQAIAVARFQKGESTDGDLATDLGDLGLDPDRVGTIVTLEKIRKLPRPRAAKA